MHARHLALLALVSAGVTQGTNAQTPSEARGPRQRPGAMGMPGQRPPMPEGRTPAARLLQMRTPLALTDDQVKKLEALQVAQRAQLEANPSAVLRVRADLMDAKKGDGDMAAAKKALDKMNQLRTERALAHLKARQDARAILSPDQKSRVDAFVSENRGKGMKGMRHMRGGRGGRGERGDRGDRGGHGWQQGPGPRPPEGSN